MTPQEPFAENVGPSTGKQYKVSCLPTAHSIVALTYLDACAMALDPADKDPTYIVTSPNVLWIPQHDLHASRPLRAGADGRFGLEDCFQYPQIFSSEHNWAVCILRRPDTVDLDSHEFSLIWWTPTVASFAMERGCTFGDMGHLKKSVVDEFVLAEGHLSSRVRLMLEWLQVPRYAHTCTFCLRSIVARLRASPMSFQDITTQVANFQRIWLDLHALLDSVEIYHPRLYSPDLPPPLADLKLMGSFTNNQEVANKMFKSGIPVWLVRRKDQMSEDIKIKQIVPYTTPPAWIETRDWIDHLSTLTKPMPTLFVGPGGRERHTRTRTMANAMWDLVRITPHVTDTDSVVEAPYVAAFSQPCALTVAPPPSPPASPPPTYLPAASGRQASSIRNPLQPSKSTIASRPLPCRLILLYDVVVYD